jgi:TolA-binding protein
MSRARFAVLLTVGATVAGAAGMAAADQRPPTIGDLKGRHVEVRTDDPVAASSDRALENYQEFLKLGNGDAALRAEAMRRLGDLKLEAGELERIEKDLAQGSPLGTGDSIVLYGKLLAAYPNYERNDAVLYQLARAYEADQQGEKALATLDQLVRRYPSSRYLDEAEFRRGEILFSARDWAGAETAYASVIRIGARSEFYAQSLYKHGWAQFKRGDSDGALGSFAKLLERELLDAKGAELDVETFTRPQRELVDDTLRVVAISFSFEDDAKGVDSFLKHHGDKPYAHLLYGALGDLYVSKERWTDAADAYRAFSKRAPDNEHAPLLQMAAIAAYKRGGFASLVLDGKREYVDRYKLGSPFWAHRQPADAPLVVRELKVNVQDLAAFYHAQAQSSKSPADYQEAARWYRTFLQSFPDDPEAAASNYLLADTLFESHQFHDAAVEYERTAYAYTPNAKSATAGYAALVAYDKEEASLNGAPRSEWHRQGLESGLRFATTFQEHPESVPVLVRTAREYYDVKEYAKAIDVADIVLARRPSVDVDKQRMAWTVIANGQFELGQFDKAEGAYLQVQTLLPPNDPQRAAIDERVAASVYKQGEARKAAGDEAGAVVDFLRVAQLAPNAKIRATADYDAAALLISLKDWPKAIAVLEGFRRDFPASELQPEVTRKLAVAYLAADQPGPAAGEFERIASGAGGTPDVQREALAQAATLYEKSGDQARTIAAWESYVKRFPKPFEPAMEARQKLADFAGQHGDAPKRSALLEEIVRADKGAGTDRTDRSRYLAARASLELAGPSRDVFNAIRLTLPLKKSLEAKRSAMQQALKSYGAADEYAVAEVSTAATFEMAELYRHLGEDVLKSDRPKTLAGEALEQYDVLLEEQLYFLEEGERYPSRERRTRRAGHVRRGGACEFRGAGEAEAGALRQDGGGRGPGDRRGRRSRSGAAAAAPGASGGRRCRQAHVGNAGRGRAASAGSARRPARCRGAVPGGGRRRRAGQRRARRSGVRGADKRRADARRTTAQPRHRAGAHPALAGSGKCAHRGIAAQPLERGRGGRARPRQSPARQIRGRRTGLPACARARPERRPHAPQLRRAARPVPAEAGRGSAGVPELARAPGRRGQADIGLDRRAEAAARRWPEERASGGS